VRKVVAVLASVALVVLLSLGLSGSMPTDAEARTAKPNIVFILADDLDKASTQKIGRLREHIANKGVTFNNAFVTESVCCPSRATILRGQYPHNHRVRRNNPPLGGFEVFRSLGLESSTIATWLDRTAGYRTAFVGAKYMNGYGDKKRTYVPPGWDEWYALTPHHTINRNGQTREYPRGTYQDDLLSGITRDFIRRMKGKDRPFFVHLSLQAPHEPTNPAPRYEDWFKGERAPRTPSFNEANISDKPRWVRRPLLTSEAKRRIDSHYRDRLRTMAAVGEMAGKLVGALKDANKLNNTYIVFASDNGYHQGQHRLEFGKNSAYEEDIRIPLMIRGPGIPAGVKKDAMVLNNDFAPTVARWAGVTPPDFVDGRSFASLIDGNPETTPSSWRTGFSVRYWQKKSGGGTPSYQAVRTRQHLYVEYATGERELYDLQADPYQLRNFYGSADPALIAQLQSRLRELRDCSRDSCRDAEGF
jgi:N-acetylglucosamine-6-sulfatase